MIKFSHVYKTFPGAIHALRNIDLTIDKGEFLFLTGPSGAGKTTLFRLISAFDTPTNGSLEVAGFDLSRLSKSQLPLFRRKIGVVFQDFRLLEGRTAAENVSLPLRVMGEREQLIQKKVDEILDQVGLRFKSDQPVEQMSGGEKQRVAIARALIHKPGIIIADEPTGNLDPDMSLEIMSLFEKANSQGTTVFIASHDHALVKKMNKRQVMLVSGECK